MKAYREWNKTWGEVGITHSLGEHGDDYRGAGRPWRLTLSTGVDCFNLGIAIRRYRAGHQPGAFGIGFLFFLVKLEWWR